METHCFCATPTHTWVTWSKENVESKLGSKEGAMKAFRPPPCENESGCLQCLFLPVKCEMEPLFGATSFKFSGCLKLWPNRQMEGACLWEFDSTLLYAEIWTTSSCARKRMNVGSVTCILGQHPKIPWPQPTTAWPPCNCWISSMVSQGPEMR